MITKGYWRVIDTAGIIDSFQVIRVLQVINTDKVFVEFMGHDGDHLCNIKRFKWLDKIEEAEEDYDSDFDSDYDGGYKEDDWGDR